MRDLAGCFANQAVRVVCSTTGTLPAAEAAPAQGVVVTCFYKAVLSTNKELFVQVTWAKATPTHTGGVCLSVAASDDESDEGRKHQQLLHKKKGARCFLAGETVVSLHWDISAAKFEFGPEPRKDFYVAAIADEELVLLLGDACREKIEKCYFKDAAGAEPPPIAEIAMVRRREQVRGTTGLYSTRAQFTSDGKKHEISIGWKKGDDERDAADGSSELRVTVDDKTLVSVKRLRWNFRGNETIFVDGATIDVMWDVHGWWFCGPEPAPAAFRCAIFMFRTRRTLEHRLWLEEEQGGAANGVTPAFSLLIQAFNGQ